MASIPRDIFSEEERHILRRYFTNLDGPVTAIVHLPEVVVAALCARAARSHRSIRRLFLEEFLPDLDTSEDAHLDATAGHGAPNHWYQEVFDQLGGGGGGARQFAPLHLHVEGISLLAAKTLERGRLMSYLEGSTRSQPYDERLPSGQYRYVRPTEILDSPLGTRYVGDLDRTFDAYREVKSLLQAWIEPRLKADFDDVTCRRLSAQQSLDAARGLLPVATLNTVSLFGNAMTYAQLLVRLESSELQELRALAPLVRTELERVFPQSLFGLSDEAASYRETNYVVMREVEKALQPRLRALSSQHHRATAAQGLEVTLVDFDPKGEDHVLAAMLYEVSGEPFTVLEDRVQALDPDQRREVFAAYVGNRSNRDLRPGRALEHTGYHFEIVGDYGSYRDLQRHRMLTPLRQSLTGDLGFVLPSLVEQADGAALFVTTVQRAVSLWEELLDEVPECAAYALTMSNRIRYSLRLNAREALHVLELRSNQPGHEAYRAIAQSMHRAIAEQAGHRNIAEAMRYVNHDDPGNVYNSGSSLRERFMDGEEEARRRDR